MQTLNDDNSRLKTEAAAMTTTNDTLKTEMAALEKSNSSLTQDKASLLRDTEQLRSDKEHLIAENESLTAEGLALREEKAGLEAAANPIIEVNTDESKYDEQLASAVASAREEKVAELTSQIEKCSTLQDELKALSAQLTGEQTAKKVRLSGGRGVSGGSVCGGGMSCAVCYMY